MHQHTLIYVESLTSQVLTEDCYKILQNNKILVTSLKDKGLVHLALPGTRFAILIATELNANTRAFLRAAQEKFKVLGQVFILVADDPSLTLQMQAYELGIEQVWGSSGFTGRLMDWIEDRALLLADSQTTPEAATLQLVVAMVSQDELATTNLVTFLAPEASFDARTAFLLGHAYNRLNKPVDAETTFSLARKLNPKSVPILAALAESQLASGKSEAALEVFGLLEKVNGGNAERKASMASALADLGRWQESSACLEAASLLSPELPRLNELKVRHAFHSGRVDDALGHLDHCQGLSDYFLSKLNEEAIAFAKKGMNEAAFSLYAKAHRIAPEQTKYKLSYNIALAYKRQGEFAKSLMYLDRVDQECPIKPFDKSQKLRASLHEEMKKK